MNKDKIPVRSDAKPMLAEFTKKPKNTNLSNSQVTIPSLGYRQFNACPSISNTNSSTIEKAYKLLFLINIFQLKLQFNMCKLMFFLWYLLLKTYIKIKTNTQYISLNYKEKTNLS